MFALRNATRLRFRPNLINLSTRQYRSLQPTSSHLLVRSNTWKTWFFYRRDGARRSMMGGIANALFITGLCYMVLMSAKQSTAGMEQLMTILNSLQQLDTEYSNYDFDKPADTIAYQRKIMECLPVPKNNIDEVIKNIEIFVNSNEGAHLILRKYIEELHRIIQSSGHQEPLQTVGQALKTLQNCDTQLGLLINDVICEKLINKLSKDKGRISNGGRASYELVG